jgi:hypothetical protein
MQFEKNRYRTVGDRDIVCNALIDPHKKPETPILSAAILQLLCNDQLADFLKTLDGELSNGCYSIHQTILFFVPPGCDIHIDGWPLETKPWGYAHTLWIPLEDVTLLNGALAIMSWPRGRFMTPHDLGFNDFGDGGYSDQEKYMKYHEGLCRYLRDDGRPANIFPKLDVGDLISFTSLTPHGTMPFYEQHASRMALQVLLRPSMLPYSTILNALDGNYIAPSDASSSRWSIVLP